MSNETDRAMENLKRIAVFVEERLDEMRLSKTEYAARVGMSTQELRYLWMGRPWPLRTHNLAKASIALGLGPHDLKRMRDDPTYTPEPITPEQLQPQAAEMRDRAGGARERQAAISEAEQPRRRGRA